jgi:hypothetical protein
MAVAFASAPSKPSTERRWSTSSRCCGRGPGRPRRFGPP